MKIKFIAEEFYKFVSMAKKAPKKSKLQRALNVQFTEGRAEVKDLVNKAFLSLQGVELEGYSEAILIRYEELIKQINNFKTGDVIEVYNHDGRAFVEVDGNNVFSCPEVFDNPIEKYEAGDLKNAPASFMEDLKKAFSYCSKDTTKLQLNGVFYAFDGVNFCGTDGIRMIGRLDKDYSFEGAIIKRAFIDYYEAGKLNAEVYFNTEYTSCKSGNIELTVQNHEGLYPKYQNCLPSTFEREITFKKCDILKALEVIKPFTNERNHKIITYAGNNFYLRAEDPDREVFKEVYIDANIKGNFAGICFDALYMIQNIKDIDAEYITLKFNSPMSAAVFSGDGYLNLLMPVRYDSDTSEVPELNTKNSTYIKGENKPIKKAAQKKATKKATEGEEVYKPVNTEELKKKAIEDIKKDLRDEVLENLKEEIKPEVERQLREELKEGVKKELEKSLRPEVIKNIRIHNEGAIIEGLKNEYKPVIIEHLKNELKPSIEKSLHKQVYSDLKKILEHEVKSEIKKEAEDIEKAKKEDLEKIRLREELDKIIEDSIKNFEEPKEDHKETNEPDHEPVKKRGIGDLFCEAVRKCIVASGIVAGVISSVYVMF